MIRHIKAIMYPHLSKASLHNVKYLGLPKPNYKILSILAFMVFVLSACQVQENRLISETHPLPNEPLSALGWVGVRFSKPMDQASVEAAFSISPSVTG